MVFKVTADVVVLAHPLSASDPAILLVQRKHPPFEGCWALPGGHVEEDEELVEAAARELAEETGLGIDTRHLRLVHAEGGVDRDPRGRTLTLVYVAHVPSERMAEVHADDDAAAVQWFPLAELPELAFDHEHLIALATHAQP